MGAEGHIDQAVGQAQGGPLQMLQRAEVRRGDHDGAARLFGARHQVERVQALDPARRTRRAAAPHRLLGLRFDVQRLGARVDDGRRRDADFRGDVVSRLPAADVRILPRHRGDARPEEAPLPQHGARRGVGVEGIDLIALGGHEDHIVNGAADRQIRDIQRLGVDIAGHGTREQPSKG